jgi:hypothetical protein
MKQIKTTAFLGIILSLLLWGHVANAQQKKEISIFQLMERRDLRLKDIEAEGKKYFEKHGTGKGSGYKQFQRWLYEQQFHVDEQGFILPEDSDWKAYKKAKPNLKKEKNNSAGGLAPQSPGESPGAAEASAAMVTVNSWTEKGPDYKSPTSGWNPGVGRVTSIAVNPDNENEIYITSPGGGLWKTNNGGGQAGNWQPLTDNDNSLTSMFAVAIDPLNTQVVYAGSSGGRIIKSTDNGVTWADVGVGVTGHVWKIVPHPTTADIVFAATSNGIFRSEDGGATWARVQNTRKEDIEFHPTNRDIMYATGNDVYRSADGGITWTLVGVAAGITTAGRTMVSVTAADPNRVYLVQARGEEFGKFFVSYDAGLTFATLITGDAATNTNFFASGDANTTGGQAGYDMSMAASQTNADEVHIGGVNLWKTIDGGISFVKETHWASANNAIGYNHADQHALIWVSGKLYSGSDGGIYKSVDNGDSWTDLSTGLGIRQFYRIAVSKTDPDVYAGGAQDNGSSIHKTSGWVDWLGADGMDTRISPLDPNLIWGTSQNGSIYRTTNGGASYTGLTKPGNGEWVTPLAIESNTNVIYGGWNGVYKSTNLGSSWTKISGSTINTTLLQLALSPTNSNYIYTSNGNQLYTTANGGVTWNTITAPVTINSIAVSHTNPLKIWIAGNSSGFSRVMVSVDGGVTFTSIAANLPAMVARTIVVDNNQNESVYVGMNVGVYYLDNTSNGEWTDLSENLPKVAVNDLEIQKNGRLLRLGTYGRGIWERPLYNISPYGPPIVSITSPQNNQSLMSITDLTITADAADANGSVTRVEFFNKGVKIGEDLDAPYSLTLNNVGGAYSLTAVATDDAGDATTSDPINVSVNLIETETIADAYVRDGGSAATNFGVANTLDLKITSGSGFNREVYLKFDLSALPSGLNSAKLRLNVESVDASVAGLTWQGYYVPDDSWTETSITWNNKPAGTTLLTTVSGISSGYIEFNITRQVLDEIAADKILSVKLVANNNAAHTRFSSRENANVILRPQLLSFNGGPFTAPTVSITSPVNDSLFAVGSNVTINAKAVDPEGYISKVEFFKGNILLGIDSVAPYSFVINAMASGSHSFTAKATDNAGLTTVSEPVIIRVGSTPAVTELNPVADAYVRDGSTNVNTNFGTATTLVVKKDINANATTARESYLKFDLSTIPEEAIKSQLKLNISVAGATVNTTTWQIYYVPDDSWTEANITWSNKPAGTTLLATITGTNVSPVTWNISSQVAAEMAGDKILSLKIVSTNIGNTTDVQFHSREVVTLALRPVLVTNSLIYNKLPAVSITSPFSDTVIDADSAVVIEAAATDKDGSISKVEFYRGNTKLGEDTTAPYSFYWTGANPGTYSLTAKAFDNKNESTTSEPVNITFNGAPVVMIDSPLDGLTVDEHSNVTITAQSSDETGVVHKVEFFSNGILLGEDSDAPYNFNWNNVEPGNYQLKAIAIDNYGKTGASVTVNLIIRDTTPPVIVGPQNIVVSSDPMQCRAVVNYSVSATDNMPNSTVSLTAGLASGSIFPVGTSTVTHAATDAAGNTVSRSFTVTVNDTEKPVLSCPVNQQFCFTESGNYTIPTFTATDNCGINTVTYLVSGATSRTGSGNNASGVFNVGVSIIEWTATDIHGNAVTCSTEVKVNPPLAATIADVYAVSPGGHANTIYLGYGPSSLELNVLAAGGTAPYSYVWSNGSTTNTTTVNPSIVGSHTYTVTITDAVGCTTVVTKQIAVVDVRCGNNTDKVSICHIKSTSHDNTICISVVDVQSHLAHGCKLGECGQSRTSDVLPGNTLMDVKIYPNPTMSDFRMSLGNAQGEPVSIRIMDITGKVLKQIKTAGNLIVFGKELTSGVYFVEINKGNNRQTFKLIKL